MFPTHVGMDRARRLQNRGRSGVPHARGDGPNQTAIITRGHRCSPRTWGWTVVPLLCPGNCRVFPTHVGMDRLAPPSVGLRPCVPHARGDGPTGDIVMLKLKMCSPRTWGWTEAGLIAGGIAVVFPTHVGMDRERTGLATARESVPHARGDGPDLGITVSEAATCSPRTWGWTDRPRLAGRVRCVFPTHVGMDRRIPRAARTSPRVPHARGDGPQFAITCSFEKVCSPRTWGWTESAFWRKRNTIVFPTHVGMDRRNGGLEPD